PNQTFIRFVAMDSGGELAIQDMIRRGLRPGVDFGYPYGLLPMLLGRIWYGIAGLSPGAYRGLVTAWMVLSCWGLARFAVDRRLGMAGWALIVLAIPDLTIATTVTSV